MLKTILGAEWTLERELATTLDLVGRLAADSASRLVTCLIITAVVAYTASVQLAVIWGLLVVLNEYGEFRLARRIRRTDLSVHSRLVTYFVHLWLHLPPSVDTGRPNRQADRGRHFAWHPDQRVPVLQ